MKEENTGKKNLGRVDKKAPETQPRDKHNDKRMQDLREKVHSGSYRVDTVAVAKALFFWR